MDFKQLINKGKTALGKNTKVIDQGANAVNKATKGKYSSQVNKGADAAKKFAGDDKQNPNQGQNPDQPNPQ